MIHEITKLSNGKTETWIPTTLDELDKPEEFLEDVISDNPRLLCLESRRSNIAGPYAVFRQLSFDTPQGRAIRPDVVLLSASGHVIIVEVKRYVNPELRNRKVIAQIVDYASSFSALTEKELLKLFNKEKKDIKYWPELIQNYFPNDENCEELAKELLYKFQTGALNIVIACDRAPIGLSEVLSGISSQSALEFDLDLVEILPYKNNNSNDDDDIIFIPKSRMATEIVARTAVTVTYQEGSTKPSVDVRTSSVDEIEENLHAVQQGIPRAGRNYSDDEIYDAFISSDDPIAKDLIKFAKQESFEGRISSGGRTVEPNFGFYVSGKLEDGELKTLQLLNCSVVSTKIKIYFNMAESISSLELINQLKDKLKNIFMDEIDINMKEPTILLSVVADKLDEFKEIVLWFRDVIAKK